MVGRSIALVLALVAGALIAWSQLRLPEPKPADAPAAEFSAGRAMADVARVAASPHPIGSAANHKVRDALLGRMDELGLSPRVRRDNVVLARPDGSLQGGSPETLIGVLPGRDRTQPALALMAHYDSAPGAPGAADDGAGVAAALEIVRALKVRGTPARDVAVILTDGEEAGLLGARGFFAGDPLARRIGFVLNMEARGSTGRAHMFETGAANGAAMALFRDTARLPSTGSLFAEVYARLPNDTDFTLARKAGLAGFNYAFTGGAFDYHSPTDTPANLDAGSLQHLGDQVLATAARLAFDPALPERAPDAVYAVLAEDVVIAYAPAWGWALIAAAAALLVLALRRARARETLALADLARGAGGGLYLLLAASSVLHLAGLAAGQGRLGAERLLAAALRWETAQILLAAGVLTFATAEFARGKRRAASLLPLGCALAACLVARRADLIAVGSGLGATVLALIAARRALSRPAAWAGLLLLGLVASVLLQLMAPQAAYVLAWPLVSATLAAAASSLAAQRGPARLAVLGLVAALVLGWSGVHAHLIAVTTGAPVFLCLPLFMAALAIWPLVQPAAGAPAEHVAGRGLLLLGAVIVLLVRLDSPWDARRPQPAFLAYQLDRDQSRAFRLTHPSLAEAWSEAALATGGAAAGPLRHWAWDTPMRAAPATPVDRAGPELTLRRGGSGLVHLTVRPPDGARVLTLQLAPDADAALVGAGLAPMRLQLPAGRWTRLRWSAPPAEGLTLTLAPDAARSLRLRYAAEFDHWPFEIEPPPVPPPAVAPVGRSGMTLVTGTLAATW